MTLSSRDKTVLRVGIAVAALLVVVLFIFPPLAHRWCDLGTQLGPKLELFEQMRERAGRRKVLLARRTCLIRRLGWLVGPEARAGKSPQPKSAPVPTKTSSTASSLAAYLEQAARKSGVKVTSITPKKQRPGRQPTKYFRPVTLRLVFAGNIQAVVKLLHALEKGERFTRIETIQLHRDLKKSTTFNVPVDVGGYEPAGGQL